MSEWTKQHSVRPRYFVLVPGEGTEDLVRPLLTQGPQKTQKTLLTGRKGCRALALFVFHKAQLLNGTCHGSCSSNSNPPAQLRERKGRF